MELDYRLAWRSAIPTNGISNARISGFNAEETQALRAYLANLGISVIRDPAELLVANINGASGRQKLRDERPNLGSKASFILTDRLNCRSTKKVLHVNYRGTSELAMIPASNPRLMFGLRSTRLRDVLKFHSPGRISRRFLLRFVAALGAVGFRFPLKGRVAVIGREAGIKSILEEHIADIFQLPKIDQSELVTYLGSATLDRKLTVLPLVQKEGTALKQVAKIAVTEAAEQSINREVRALSELSNTTMARYIPRLVRSSTKGPVKYMVQTYCDGGPVKRYQVSLLYDALRVMAAQNRAIVSLEHLLSAMRSTFNEDLFSPLSQDEKLQLDAIARENDSYYVWRSHGDFASWNTVKSGEKIQIFDWEKSVSQDLGYSDIFYFMLSPAIINPHTELKRVSFPLTLEAAGDLLPHRHQSGVASAKAHLVVWLLREAQRTNSALILLRQFLREMRD